MTKRSPSTETAAPDANAASWADAGVEGTAGADRLSPDQPDHGLLWVTRGSLTLTRGGRVHEVRKGTVIAYRVGGGLEWSAPEGTHVRWCLRDVGVGPGQVAPWTSELVVDGPVPAAPKRRPMYVVITVAVAWLFAIGVAWCYGKSHAARIQEEMGTLRGSRSPALAYRTEVEVARGIFYAHLGVMPDLGRVSGDRKLFFVLDPALLADLPSALAAARAAADEAYLGCPSIGAIFVAFGTERDGDLPHGQGRFFRFPPGGGAEDQRATPVPSAAALW